MRRPGCARPLQAAAESTTRPARISRAWRDYLIASSRRPPQLRRAPAAPESRPMPARALTSRLVRAISHETGRSADGGSHAYVLDAPTDRTRHRAGGRAGRLRQEEAASASREEDVRRLRALPLLDKYGYVRAEKRCNELRLTGRRWGAPAQGPSGLCRS